jgi:hypothetical protein
MHFGNAFCSTLLHKALTCSSRAPQVYDKYISLKKHSHSIHLKFTTWAAYCKLLFAVVFKKYSRTIHISICTNLKKGMQSTNHCVYLIIYMDNFNNAVRS